MKILIVDDSALSRNMFKRALSDDYTIIEASDGMSGIEKYFLEKPDLVFLDITMPGSSGFDILTQLKQLDPTARVIIGTADIQQASREQALELGAMDVINKPFLPEKLRETVQNALTSAKTDETEQ